jgi:hypothetical protein
MTNNNLRYTTSGFTLEERTVLQVAEKFLEGIGTRNKEQMLEQILPEGGAALLRDGAPLFINLRGVVDRIPFDAPGTMEEIISGQPVIRVDNDIAMAWTPYEVLINGKIDHVGTDIWSFVKLDGQWYISGLADNSRKPATETAASPRQ